MICSTETVREESRILSAWLRHGTFDSANRFGFTIADEHLAFRAMQSEANSAVPSSFYRGFFSALDSINPVYRNATLIETDSGSPLTIPIVADSESAGIVAENVDNSAGADIEFDNFNLNARKYSSKILRVSNELLTDAIPAFLGQVGKVLANRIARQSNVDFTIGDGDSKPFGIVTGSMLGHTAASDTAITYGDLLELQHSVDSAYWGRSSWMLSSDSFKVVRHLRDADGNRAYERGLLFDRPVVLNNSMPTIEAESKPVLFGDLSQYVVRETGSLQIRRYGERFAESFQTGLAAVLRLDGKLSTPSAIKHLAMGEAS